MRVAIRASFALLFFPGFFAGCGQNGPLYLPGDASSIQVGTPTQNPPGQVDESANDKEKDDRE